MPTYDYRCPKGHDFEHFYRKISDSTAELTCPTCGAMAERRVSGGAGLVFKGSGFYLTDYGKNAHRKQGGDNAASKSESSGDASSKSDSKSEGGSTGSKSDSSSSGSAKSESSKSDGSKSESSKSESSKADTKPAAKPKGGDA